MHKASNIPPAKTHSNSLKQSRSLTDSATPALKKTMIFKAAPKPVFSPNAAAWKQATLPAARTGRTTLPHTPGPTRAMGPAGRHRPRSGPSLSEPSRPRGALTHRSGALLHRLLGVLHLEEVSVRGEDGDCPVVAHGCRPCVPVGPEPAASLKPAHSSPRPPPAASGAARHSGDTPTAPPAPTPCAAPKARCGGAGGGAPAALLAYGASVTHPA